MVRGSVKARQKHPRKIERCAKKKREDVPNTKIICVTVCA